MQPLNQGSWLTSLLCVLSLSVSMAFAGVDVYQFDKPEQERLYHQLIDELRCMVCQNQNLAGSNAELAVDLRRQVYEMITQQQASYTEITDYMVNRYGDFVLYNPPLKTSTMMLWGGPLFLLLLGLLVGFRFVKSIRKQPEVTLNHTQQNEVRDLLANNHKGE